MGELWRSEEMQLVQLYVQMEAAHDTVDELGQLGLIQFRDLNPHVTSFQRHFINEVKRTEEMARKLRFFETQIEQTNTEAKNERRNEVIVIEEPKDETKVHMDDLEAKFEEREKQIQQANTHQEALTRNYNQLKELKHVLQKDTHFFSEATEKEELEKSESSALLDTEDAGKGLNVKLGFISGVILTSKFHVFNRILFRATRGNLFMKYDPIEDDNDYKEYIPGTSEEKKNVFIIFFQGDALRAKIKKICESLGANLYPIPETAQERKGLLEQVETRLEDLDALLKRGLDQKYQVLREIAVHLRFWQQKITKEKAIYHTMNKFNYDLGRKCLIAEGWCPTSATEQVQIALRTARERSNALVPSILHIISSRDEAPPTYFRTNKFTRAFQGIVDAYGVARYREVNPAVLTIVTFPFEFGLMFGDLGHGILLLIGSLLLIRMEKKWEEKKINEMIEMAYLGRYCLLLMSLFAIYTGILYNELFALPMDLGSNWKLELGSRFNNNTFTRRDESKQYVFGVDPVWKGATNELLFYNSLKMKMSIIIGVLQMSIGLILHCLNAIHFRKELDIYFEFIPRFLFLQCFFGYLCFLIFYKWNTDYIGQDKDNQLNSRTGNQTFYPYCGTGNAPVILNMLIYMLLPGGPDNNPMYGAQKYVQPVLVAIALVCVPLMMLPKPLILRYRHNRDNYHKLQEEDVKKVHVEEEDEESEDHSGAGGHGDHFEFGELMVHQILETIEFVLGSVSHTASYLRLWALSLAHSELATVFWDKILLQLIEYSLPLGWGVVSLALFAGFSAWFFATMLVLMFMEVLSAFLHALRLHWVEFQSKFYRGDGYAFTPFSYRKILAGEDEELSS